MEKEKRNYLSNMVLEHLKGIREARIRESLGREKMLTQITGGALVVSLTLLTTFIVGGLAGKNIIIFAWIFLVLTIIFNFISSVIVDWHFIIEENKTRKWRDNGMDELQVPLDGNSWTKATRTLNYLSYLFFVLGLILLGCFGIININNMSNNKNSQRVTGIKFTKSEPLTSGPSLNDLVVSAPIPDQFKPSSDGQGSPSLSSKK